MNESRKARRSARIERRFMERYSRAEKWIKWHLRKVVHPDLREELEAESMAILWRSFARLSRQGRKPEGFFATLVKRCADAARQGRRIVGTEKCGSVGSAMGIILHGRKVLSCPIGHASCAGAIRDQVAETRSYDPSERAGFLIDFGAWLQHLSPVRREVVQALGMGEMVNAVAKLVDVSSSRISQMRRELADDWKTFVGEE